MDEPFSNLDPSVRAGVRHEVRSLLQDVGITAIIVTHDQEEALSLAAEVAVMQEGRILQFGSPAEVYGRPASRAVGEFVGAANFLTGMVRGNAVETALGTMPVDAGFEGAADVMLRAEGLAISESGGAEAEVVDIDYYGHDQMVTARLTTGDVVRIRVLSAPGIEPGSKIGVLIKGEVFVFPKA
jgi:iron(III) transport system ATP-binding protein